MFVLHFTRHYKQQVGLIVDNFMWERVQWHKSVKCNSYQISISKSGEHTRLLSTIDEWWHLHRVLITCLIPQQFDNKSKKSRMWDTVIGAVRLVSPEPGKMTLRITSLLSLTLFRTQWLFAQRSDPGPDINSVTILVENVKIQLVRWVSVFVSCDTCYHEIVTLAWQKHDNIKPKSWTKVLKWPNIIGNNVSFFGWNNGTILFEPVG